MISVNPDQNISNLLPTGMKWGFWWHIQIVAITQFSGGTTNYFSTHVELTKPKKIQPMSQTVSMDKSYLSSVPVPELQRLSW